MNAYLASMYGTGKPVEQNGDAEKIAQAELFAKVAAEAQIDLSQYSKEQINELFNEVIVKSAAEQKAPKVEETQKEAQASLEAAAREEWSRTKEAQAQWDEADRTGRQMAHAYVAEMRKIAADGGLDFLSKLAGGLPPQFAAHMKGKDGEGKKEEKGEPPHAEKKEEKKEEKDGKKEAQAAVLSKLSSAAGPVAIQLLVERGFNQDEVTRKVAAVLELGLADGDMSKVASASSFEAATGIRALEICEKLGFEIDWSKVQA